MPYGVGVVKTWLAAAVVVLATACQSTGTPDPAPSSLRALPGDQDKSPNLGIEFWEDGHPSPIAVRDDVVETHLDGEFELHFPRRSSDRPLMIGAWTDRTIFVLEPGRKVNEVPYFMPGTGGSDERSGRMTMFLGTGTHSHLVGDRVQQHGERQEKVLFKALETSDDLNTDSVYAAIFLDRDGDEVIDANEFDYFRIRLA